MLVWQVLEWRQRLEMDVNWASQGKHSPEGEDDYQDFKAGSYYLWIVPRPAMSIDLIAGTKAEVRGR